MFRKMTPVAESLMGANDEAGVELQGFLQRYPLRPYRHPEDGAYPPIELEPVYPDDGLRYLNEVPAAMPEGKPRIIDDDDGENLHLWVIDECGRVCIAQDPLPRLGDTKLHHTNLTGGGKASIGGEIWVDELPRIYLSGSSGRYPPEHPEHLEDAERLFSVVGFEVESLGWDEEIDKPKRVWID